MSGCIYCGNNPANHHATWVSSTSSILLRPRNPGSWWQTLSVRFAHAIFRAALSLLVWLHLAKISDDVHVACSERGKVFWEEAKRRGIVMQRFVLFGRQTDAYRARLLGRTIVFTALPRPIISASGSEWWIDDKWLLKEKLQTAGVLVPDGGVCTTYEEARAIFHRIEKPVIVKPRVGSRGRHTTTHVYTEEDLHTAFDRAQQLCHWVVVEQHLIGAVYRGTVIDGVLIGVLSGEPPRVVGDGTRTIEELIRDKGARKHKKVSDVSVGVHHHAFLARTGRTLGTVPNKGEVVDLLEKVGVSYGGHSAEVTGITHPEIKNILERAAKVVDDPVIGFDFIIPDITKSPAQQRWGIIECNSVPFINLHHDPVEGEPVNVASALWDYVEAHIELF
jgi:cyanophycin synthetase